MTEIEYRLADLINFSSSQKPIEFGDAFKSIITDRISSAIEAQKTNIAKSIFNTDGPEDDEDDDFFDDEDDFDSEE
jgi:ribosomal protein L9